MLALEVASAKVRVVLGGLERLKSGNFRHVYEMKLAKGKSGLCGVGGLCKSEQQWEFAE